jgi:hypothetical protein
MIALYLLGIFLSWLFRKRAKPATA